MWYMKQSTRLAMNNLLKYFHSSTVLFQVKFTWIAYEKLQPTNLCTAFYVLSFLHCTTLFLSNPMFNFKPHCWLEYLQYPESVCVNLFLCICNFKNAFIFSEFYQRSVIRLFENGNSVPRWQNIELYHWIRRYEIMK